MAELRKYNVAATILFVLITKGGADLKTGASFAAGDVKIIKDEGASANTTNLPVDEGNGWYSLALTATEMQAARIAITCVDQSAPKVFEDQAALIDTYGHASAQHELDLDIAAGWPGVADAILSRPISNVEPSSVFRTLYGAICALVNRRRINAGNLEVYGSDDATLKGTLVVTTDAAQNPIKELDTV